MAERFRDPDRELFELHVVGQFLIEKGLREGTFIQEGEFVMHMTTGMRYKFGDRLWYSWDLWSIAEERFPEKGVCQTTLAPIFAVLKEKVSANGSSAS